MFVPMTNQIDGMFPGHWLVKMDTSRHGCRNNRIYHCLIHRSHEQQHYEKDVLFRSVSIRIHLKVQDLQSVLLPLLSFTIVVSRMVVIFVAVHLILSPIVCISTYRSITTLILSPPVVTALNRSNLIMGIPT